MHVLRITLPRTGAFSRWESAVSTKNKPSSRLWILPLIRFIGRITAVTVSAAMAPIPKSEALKDLECFALPVSKPSRRRTVTAVIRPMNLIKGKIQRLGVVFRGDCRLQLS